MSFRDLDRGEAVRQQIIHEYGGANIQVRKLDLLDFDSIRQFAAHFNALTEPRIDVLIQNAGTMAYSRRLIGDPGIDSNMMTNVVGPVYLFNSLLPHFEATSRQQHQSPRVIFVSSALGARGNLTSSNPLLRAPTDWTPQKSYANSKQVLNLCAQVIHRRFKQTVDVYTLVTGGMVNTNLNREVLQNLPGPVKWLAQSASSFLLKSPLEGCQTVLHCAISSDVANMHVESKEKQILLENNGRGLLYRNCMPVEWPASSQSVELADTIFAEVEDFISNQIE